MAEESERTLRRRAEAETQTLKVEVDRLAYECSRLSRKLEHVSALLYELRALPALDEQAQLRIEDALAFDGRTEPASAEGWADFDLVPETSADQGLSAPVNQAAAAQPDLGAPNELRERDR
jgi:hypothetical protein